MAEIWKEIPGTSGLYLASTGGRVRSIPRQGTSGGIVTPSYSRKGYEIISISVDNERITKQVHQLIAGTFIPNPANKPQVNHINGDKLDNRFTNLEWVTNKENKSHAAKNNLVSSKLNGKQVHEIISLYRQDGLTQYEIAEIFDIDQSNVSYIVNNKTWGHLSSG